MKQTRTVIHDDTHFDIETRMLTGDGVWVWAVTSCNVRINPAEVFRLYQELWGYNGLRLENNMTDTISTLRKEWLSEKSDELEAMISAARLARDAAEDADNQHLVERYDILIDNLLAQKDGLLAECPFKLAVGITPEERARRDAAYIAHQKEMHSLPTWNFNAWAREIQKEAKA